MYRTVPVGTSWVKDRYEFTRERYRTMTLVGLPTPPEPFLTREELAAELKVHLNTVARWAKQPGFPEEAWGPRTLRYQMTPVLRWLRERDHRDAA